MGEHHFCPENIQKNSRITVVGIGGIGGYVSALLAGTYAHVTLAARGERKKSLETDGIRLHSDFHGEILAKAEKIVESTAEIKEIQDVVFICVKNYSLEEVCQDLRGCVDEHTVIVPVMNGADTGERTRKFLQNGIVVDSVIYITSFFNEDYSVTQIGNYAKIQIGIKNPNEKEKQAVEAVWNCMCAAGMDCHISEDVEAAVWEKYIFNCGYNVITAYYMEMAETLQQSAEKCREFRILMEEALAVAMAKEVSVREGYIESEYARFMNLDAGSTSSLKRDIEAGRKNELETFGGYLIREAHRLNVPAPLSEKMYREMSGLS